MTIDNLEILKEQRKENLEKIGQYMLQKQYYENAIEKKLIQQKQLCDAIFKLEKFENEEQ